MFVIARAGALAALAACCVTAGCADPPAQQSPQQTASASPATAGPAGAQRYAAVSASRLHAAAEATRTAIDHYAALFGITARTAVRRAGLAWFRQAFELRLPRVSVYLNSTKTPDTVWLVSGDHWQAVHLSGVVARASTLGPLRTSTFPVHSPLLVPVTGVGTVSNEQLHAEAVQVAEAIDARAAVLGTDARRAVARQVREGLAYDLGLRLAGVAVYVDSARTPTVARVTSGQRSVTLQLPSDPSADTTVGAVVRTGVPVGDDVWVGA